jgi:hypothetical protein
VCVLLLQAAGWSVIATDELALQRAQFKAGEREIRELTIDLFRFRPDVDERTVIDLPYDEQADVRSIVAAARQNAQASGKFLMITFGANSGADCRRL